jgi:hypothetical protein
MEILWSFVTNRNDFYNLFLEITKFVFTEIIK